MRGGRGSQEIWEKQLDKVNVFLVFHLKVTLSCCATACVGINKAVVGGGASADAEIPAQS